MDVTVNATTFLVTGCLAWNTVAADLRPRCVSLMDANRADWYVRHTGYNVRVDSEHASQDLPLFRLDSSFILHADSFYPGHYALESTNFPDNYIRLQDDGYFWIEPEAYTTEYIIAASFAFYEHDSSRKYTIILAPFLHRQKDPSGVHVIIIRPHRSTYVDAAYCYRPSSVVCLSAVSYTHLTLPTILRV